MVMLSAENALDDIAGDSGRSGMMEEMEGIEGRRRFSGVYIPRGVLPRPLMQVCRQIETYVLSEWELNSLLK